MSRLDAIRDMLAREPADVFLNYALAMELLGSGQTQDGVVQLRRMTQAVAPDYAPAYHQLGLALDKLGLTDEARTALTAGIAVAERQGNSHAAGEMRDLLSSLD